MENKRTQWADEWIARVQAIRVVLAEEGADAATAEFHLALALYLFEWELEQEELDAEVDIVNDAPNSKEGTEAFASESDDDTVRLFVFWLVVPLVVLCLAISLSDGATIRENTD